MANYRMNKIAIGSNTYECAEWYGVCSTAAATQAKTVSISGFTSAQLVEGCKVTVRFQNYQGYNGAPTLNVSATGGKTIQSVVGTSAGQYEWSGGQIVAFVYYNGYWVIEDGGHASSIRYGKAILTNSVSGYSTTEAVTPSGVIEYVEGFFPYEYWDGEDVTVAVALSGTTPSASGWTIEGDIAVYSFSFDQEAANAVLNASRRIRALRVTVGDDESFAFYGRGEFTFYGTFFAGDATLYLEYGGYGEVIVPSGEEGAFTYKCEVIYASAPATGLIMTEPLMDYYLKDNGYLTLADLPVWDGSVT